MRSLRLVVLLGGLLGSFGHGLADGPAAPGPKEALQPFQDLIGAWRATGQPEGTAEQKRTGFWTEALAWEWRFPKEGPCLALTCERGKYFTRGSLHYLPEKQRYRLHLVDRRQAEAVFEGTFKNRILTLDRDDPATHETQRLVFTLLHDNRFLYRYEVRPAGQTWFQRFYQVGATKEGVPFAAGTGQPECIVSGGLGTIKVTHQGKSYYVCCGGCRDAFNEEPEKYVKEYEAKKAKK